MRLNWFSVAYYTLFGWICGKNLLHFTDCFRIIVEGRKWLKWLVGHEIFNPQFYEFHV